MARETAFYAFAASHEKWGIWEILTDSDYVNLINDSWDIGAPDTDQTTTAGMGALEITHETAFSNVTDEAVRQAKNNAGLSAVCGQLFCQQTAKNTVS